MLFLGNKLINTKNNYVEVITMTERYSTKAGRESHSLVEPAFFYGLGLVGRMLEGRVIPHAFYGGVGAQIYIAKALAGDKPIDTVPLVSALTRKTSDYDIAIPVHEKEANLEASVGAFVGRNEYGFDTTFEEPSGDYIFQTRLDRMGSRRPVVVIKGGCIEESGVWEESKIHVTFDKDEPHHTEMAESPRSSLIKLVHSRVGELEIVVAPIEYVIAGKLGRGNVNDIIDSLRVVNLYPSMDLDLLRDVAKRMAKTERRDQTGFYSIKGIEELREYIESRLPADFEG